MSVSREFEGYVIEQLAAAGSVTSRRMFGGVGIYLDGAFVGLVAPGSSDLYLKVDATTRGKYEAAGMMPFRPYADRATVMPFYQVPAEVLENSDALATWAREAYRIAGSSGGRPRVRDAKKTAPARRRSTARPRNRAT
jgi:DNA transformation protein